MATRRISCTLDTRCLACLEDARREEAARGAPHKCSAYPLSRCCARWSAYVHTARPMRLARNLIVFAGDRLHAEPKENDFLDLRDLGRCNTTRPGYRAALTSADNQTRRRCPGLIKDLRDMLAKSQRAPWRATLIVSRVADSEGSWRKKKVKVRTGSTEISCNSTLSPQAPTRHQHLLLLLFQTPRALTSPPPYAYRSVAGQEPAPPILHLS
jgi:hypothetical protein